jgi:hypothetical protein
MARIQDAAESLDVAAVLALEERVSFIDEHCGRA